MQTLDAGNKKSAKDKYAGHGLHFLIGIAAVLAIVVLVNLIVQQLAFRLDFTANGLYSIGETTQTVLGGLKKNVVIYGLFDDGRLDNDYKGVKELLNNYVRRSNGHVTVRYVDPDKNTQIVHQIDPKGTLNLEKNDFVVVSGDRSRKLSYSTLFETDVNQVTLNQYVTGSNAEQGFTSAIKYVTANLTPTVYFVQDNGEEDLRTSYKSFAANLETDNFTLKNLNLNTVSAVPDDADILVFLSPKRDLTPAQGTIVAKYLNGGGKAAFLLDSVSSGASFSEFSSMLAPYTLTLRNDRVTETDASKHLPGSADSLLLDVASSKVVPLEFSGLLMKDARSIGLLKNDSARVKVTTLVQTAASAVGEQISTADGGNLSGPLVLAAAVESTATEKPSRIFVIGSTDVLTENEKETDTSYFSPASYLFVSAFDWLKGESTDVVISAKPYQNGKISISESSAYAIGVVVIFVVPVIIFICGLVVWQKRKQL